jgi:Helix-turn-helix domain
VSPLDTRYVTDTGRPLLRAGQAAEIYDVKPRTIYQWRRRGFLAVRGLDDDGRELYDAGEVAAVKAKPRHRAAA